MNQNNSDMWFFLGLVILCIIIIIYIMTLFVLYIRKNPTASTITINLPLEEKSIVTHTYLGKRGDMRNQLVQLACIIAAGERSKANVIFPTFIS